MGRNGVPVFPETDKPPKGAERSLLEAVARLRAGTPRDPALQVRAKAGKLKVNATTATLEAGCARRLAYEYTRVRQALGIDPGVDLAGSEITPRTGRKSLQQIVVQLRADNAELRRERDKAVSMAASLVIRMRNMERDVDREIRKAQRKALDPEGRHQVTGNVHRFRPRGGETE